MYRRWERKSSKGVGSGRNRGNYAIFRNRNRAKMVEAKKKRPGSRGYKIRGAGSLDRRKCIFVYRGMLFRERGVILIWE